MGTFSRPWCDCDVSGLLARPGLCASRFSAVITGREFWWKHIFNVK